MFYCKYLVAFNAILKFFFIMVLTIILIISVHLSTYTSGIVNKSCLFLKSFSLQLLFDCLDWITIYFLLIRLFFLLSSFSMRLYLIFCISFILFLLVFITTLRQLLVSNQNLNKKKYPPSSNPCCLITILKWWSESCNKRQW